MSKLPLALWQKISFSPPICSVSFNFIQYFHCMNWYFRACFIPARKESNIPLLLNIFFTTFAMQNTIGAVCLILKIFLMIEHTRFLCSFFSVLEFTCINFLFLVSLLLNSVKPECLFVGTSQAARSEYQGRTFCA